MSKWERDECLPEIDKVVSLCKLFNISTDELLSNKYTNLTESQTGQTNNIEQYDKRMKRGKIILIIGLVSIVISILLTEAWSLMDSMRSGSWYTNKLLYLVKSPLAIIFVLAITTTIIGFMILAKNKIKIKKKKYDLVFCKNATSLGIILITLSTIIIFFCLITANSDFWNFPLPNRQDAYIILSTFIFPLTLALFVLGVIFIVLGIKSYAKSDFDSNKLISKTLKKMLLISSIIFGLSIIISLIVYWYIKANTYLPEHVLALQIICNIIQSASLYSIIISLILMLRLYIKNRQMRR